MILEDALLKTFSNESGQTYPIGPAEVLFILLETLKSGRSLQFGRTQFRIPVNTFKRLLSSTMKIVSDDKYNPRRCSC